MSHLVGVKVYEEYAWEFDGRRHFAIHGHQFDRFVVNNWLLSSLNSFLHLQLQKLDFKGKWFSRLVDRLGTRWLRLSAKVASGAIVHARLRQVQRMFCGHTHVALYREQGRGRVLQRRGLDRRDADLPDGGRGRSSHP